MKELLSKLQQAMYLIPEESIDTVYIDGYTVSVHLSVQAEFRCQLDILSGYQWDTIKDNVSADFTTNEHSMIVMENITTTNPEAELFNNSYRTIKNKLNYLMGVLNNA